MTRPGARVARVALVLRAVLCERSFAHVLDRGGMRRTWLRGRENVAKRYLIHVAAHNLGLIMRALFGAGTPRAAADLRLLWLAAGDRFLLVLFAGPRDWIDRPGHTSRDRAHHCHSRRCTFINGLLSCSQSSPWTRRRVSDMRRSCGR